MEAARMAADAIRGGSLLFEPIEEWSQVHHSAWEFLAKINELGLITFNSQDSIEAVDGSVKSYERSYVEGLMPPDEAMKFCEIMNLFTDKVAYFNAAKLDDDTKNSEIILRPEIIVTARSAPRNRIQRGYGLQLDHKPIMISYFKQSVHVPEDIPVLVVSVFDPKWGRPARYRNGLFTDIIKALTPGTFPWAVNKDLQKLYRKYKLKGD